MIEVPQGQLYLGEAIDPSSHERNGEAVLLEATDLTTHGVIVGMTGSGKTGLGVVMLEEALLAGIPTLILDPKGDLPNLLLTFPELDAGSFSPWVDGADAAKVAESWKEGLAGWGIESGRIQALRDAAELTIYTPGSTSGVPLNVVGGLRRPPEGTDTEVIADEVEGFVSGLLGLVDIEADPLSSREHILLANLVAKAWGEGQDLDLATLVGQVQTPPLRKLGVFELDAFFPPDDRTKLAMRLNGLLASPAFAAWAQGPDLDIDAMLRPGGKPAGAIVGLAHLSDQERQFVVTLVLSKLVTWMRRQPGTDQLRVLVYFDEVMGYVPPNGAPPAKKPILTLLKQARAFGVGLVLATQNPVDVDYKALSNAGTWMVGRLQTEQDKARLLDGLSAAAGGVDVNKVSGIISGLDKREFVLKQAGSDQPTVFTTRWAMSYLRGPITREQISTLMANRRSGAEEVPVTEAAPTAPEASPEATGEATPVAPTVAEGVAVRWLDPAAPWAAQVGAVATGTRLVAGIAAAVDLLYDDSAADLRHTERYEAVLVPLSDPPDVDALVPVDHDPRDMRDAPPAGATYVLPNAKIGTKGYFTTLQRAIVDHLLRTRALSIQRNPDLKLASRPGETPEEFAARCETAADEGADAATAALAKKYEARIDRARDALAAAQDRVEQAKTVETSRKSDEMLSGAGDLLGAILGGRRSARSIGSKIGSVTRRRGRASEASKRTETAANRADEKAQALVDLEADLADDVAAITDEWNAKAAAIEPLEVALEKTDVRVSELTLIWVPAT